MAQNPTYQYGNGVVLNAKRHEDVLKYIKDRLDYGKEQRDVFADRFSAIDKMYHGHRTLSDDDKKRMRETVEGLASKPVAHNVPYAAAHIDDVVTNLLVMFYETIGLYQAVAEKEFANVARAFTETMNKHAADFGHVSQLVLFLQHAIKYDWGGLAIDWIEEIAAKPEVGVAGGVDFKDQVIRKGNRLTVLDPYNTLVDPSVPLIEVPTRGEFFATVDIINLFQIHRMLNAEEIIDKDDFVEEEKFGDICYHRNKPTIDNVAFANDGNNEHSWDEDLADANPNSMNQVGHKRKVEKIDYIGWLPNRLMSLVASKENKHALSMWQVTIIGGEHIVAMKRLDYQHGMLPCCFAKPMFDVKGLRTRSQFEMIAPLQTQANFEMDVAVESKRAALYDHIFVDGRAVGKRTPEQIAKERVSILDGHYLKDKSITSAMHVVQHKPLDGTQEAVSYLNDVMNLIIPTGRVEQVADLQRATSYQAAAVVQGTNKRQYKQAVVIRDQALRICSQQMYYNILQFESSIEVLTDSGERIEAKASEFIDAGIQYKIGEGLKGLDRLRVESFWKEIMNAVIQNAQALQRIDIIKLMNHVSDIAGDGQDISQFEIESPIDTLDPDSKQQAYDLFLQQQEAGETDEG